MGLIILVPILMVMDFFGANITDGYVESNMDYADKYKVVLNNNITKNQNGYVSLKRILYFYLENDSLSFDEIYKDNLDSELKQILPISDVCKKDKYKNYEGCKNLNDNQINEIQAKPFSPPVELSNATITSFFMEERIVFGESDVHQAWDLAMSNQSNVYSVCDGTVKKVSFSYTENVTNTSAGGGNQIELECTIDDFTYTVLYAHLYPNSNKVNVGDKVTQGQLIGGVGTTGYSTGPHLHFQVKLDNNYIDGMSLINFNLEEKDGHDFNNKFDNNGYFGG